MSARKSTLLSVFILALCFVVDFSSKKIAFKHLTVVQNEGIAFGLFSELPRSFQTLSLSVVFCLILLIFILCQSLVLPKLTMLRVSLSFFFGGTLSNVVDRFIDGKTIDFIPLFNRYHCNIADVIIFISLFFILKEIFTKHEQIWFPQSERKKYLIDLSLIHI